MVTSRALPPADATHPEGFSHLFSFAELADGTVLVSDPREGAIFALDPELQSRRQVGRTGQGPLEYSSPGLLLQFSPDSVLQVDVRSGRMLMLVGDSIVAHVPRDPASSFTRDSEFGADSRGRLLRTSAPRLTDGGSTVTAADSAVLVLVNRSDFRADTIGRMRMTTPRPPGKEFAAYYDAEQAFVAMDGSVAVVRREPYRVDWRSPDGRWTYGKPIVPGERPLGASEREHLITTSGVESMGPDWATRIHWLSIVPAVGFQFPGRVMTRSGQIVLRRQPTAGVSGESYDVIDRRGDVVDRLQLEPGAWILGFGAKHVYVVRPDDDGLQFLSRHPWGS